MSPADPGLFFDGRPLVTDSISLLVLTLFRFLTSSWFSFGRACVSVNLCLSSRFPNLLAHTSSK